MNHLEINGTQAKYKNVDITSLAFYWLHTLKFILCYLKLLGCEVCCKVTLVKSPNEQHCPYQVLVDLAETSNIYAFNLKLPCIVYKKQ